MRFKTTEPEMKRLRTIRPRLALVLMLSWIVSSAQQSPAPIPANALKFGVFEAKFDPGGTFTLQGFRWPTLNGKWKTGGNVIELTMTGGPGGCDGAGRYEFHVDEKTADRVDFKLITDDCAVRRIILDGSE